MLSFFILASSIGYYCLGLYAIWRERCRLSPEEAARPVVQQALAVLTTAISQHWSVRKKLWFTDWCLVMVVTMRLALRLFMQLVQCYLTNSTTMP